MMDLQDELVKIREIIERVCAHLEDVANRIEKTKLA